MIVFGLICKRNLRMPYILDLVQDNVRTRIIFPLISLAMFILVIFTIESILEIVFFYITKKINNLFLLFEIN